MRMKKNARLTGLLCLLFFLPVFSFAQAKTIKGKVYAPDNTALGGVTVAVKGGKKKTVTNEQGAFSIAVPDSASPVLVFSYVGYQVQELAATSSFMEVRMLSVSNALNDVIVVGYGTQRKKDVTGAVASLNNEKITQTGVPSPSQALQGRVAGVMVDRSGVRPGDDARVQIRGRRSIKTGSDPLYVIDGIPIDVGISELNPNEIESMEILKDASATAIYGSRGANGVILITTKRGKTGRPRISYDGYIGFQSPLRLEKRMNAAQFAEYRREAFRNTYTNGVSQYPSDVPDQNLDRDLFKQDPLVQQNVMNAYVNGQYDPSRLVGTDWASLVLRDGFAQNHALNVTAGNDKTKLLFSVGYYQETGLQKNQDYNRWNVRLTVDQEISSRIKMGMASYFASYLQNYGSDLYSSTNNINPLAKPYDSTGKLIFQPGNDGLIYNPLFDIKGRIDERRKYRYLGSFYTEVKLAKSLRYRFNFGVDYAPYRQGEFQDVLSTTRQGGTSYAHLNNDNRFNYNLQNLLYYDTKFGKHSLSTTLLQELQGYRYESADIKAFGLPYSTQLWYNIGTAANIQSIGSSFSKRKLASFMGRVNYGFNSRYLLTLSLRADGASVLSEGNKYAYFPSAAFAWRLIDEPFMRHSKTVNDLKLRLGYGRTGNSSINPYQTQGSLTQNWYVWDETAASGFRPNLIPNPNLKWETTGQYNVGVDFSLFNNRVSGTIDAYYQKTTNLLLDRQLPTASGFGIITENVGSTSNRGLEISLSTVNIQTKSGFTWTTDFMFYANRERIESLYKGKVNDVANKWFIGQPISVFYDYKKTGIWQNNPEDLALMQQYNANGSNFKPGYIKLDDPFNTKDHKITADDREILGSISPRWIGSVNSRWAYKGFDLSVFVYTKQKFMVNNDRGISLSGRYNQINVDYWTPKNPTNAYPRPNAGLEQPDYQGTMYYEDGSWVKIKLIQLGYAFPSQWTQRMHMQNARFYVSLQNFFLFSHSSALDPEVYNSDNNAPLRAPSAKTITLGVNVNF